VQKRITGKVIAAEDRHLLFNHPAKKQSE